MSSYEYTVVHAPPDGILLMPWATQAVRDAVGRGPSPQGQAGGVIDEKHNAVAR
jgi:hypothetical protein